MRFVGLCAVIVLSACSTQPIKPGYDISDFDNLRPDCGQAQSQAVYLKSRIDEFHAYFGSRPDQLTQPYRQYYTRLKNNLWSLRASCSVLQR
jgi:hypothetical protein